MKLTAITRAGALATTQTAAIVDAMLAKHADLVIDTRHISTAGDQDRTTTLWTLKDSGFFTNQLEQTLLAGQGDLAVHSLKDLPTEDKSNLKIAAICMRRYPQDCLLSTSGVSSVDDLPAEARVGTSSLRRACQMRRLRSDLRIEPIRGNVPTRIQKLEQGQYDAIILARAGLERLGLMEKVSFSFSPDEFIPAPGQGALAVQIRGDNQKLARLLDSIDDSQARLCCLAERHILTVLRCGCHAPVGAYARIEAGRMQLTAFVSTIDGHTFIQHDIQGPAENWQELAGDLAGQLLQSGARQILKELQR